MTAGAEQSVEDIDGLEDQLTALNPGDEVRIEWGSSRANGTVECEAVVDDPDHYEGGSAPLAHVRTDRHKGPLYFDRRGDYEISVVAIGSRFNNRNTTIGWLVDVEALEDGGSA